MTCIMYWNVLGTFVSPKGMRKNQCSLWCDIIAAFRIFFHISGLASSHYGRQERIWLQPRREHQRINPFLGLGPSILLLTHWVFYNHCRRTGWRLFGVWRLLVLRTWYVSFWLLSEPEFCRFSPSWTHSSSAQRNKEPSGRIWMFLQKTRSVVLSN